MALTFKDVQKNAATMVVAAGNDHHTGRCRLIGYSLTAAGDTASLSMYDAVTAAGTDVITVKAATNTTVTQWFGPEGVRFSTGLSSGTTGTSPTLAIFYKPDVVNP